MIDRQSLYDVVSGPSLHLDCAPRGHPQSLFDAAAKALRAEGLGLSHLGLFSVETSMVLIPVAEASTVEEAMRQHGLTPAGNVGLFAVFSAPAVGPVIIQFPGPKPFDPDDSSSVFVQLPMERPRVGAWFHSLAERLIPAIDARCGIGWLPASRPFGVPKRKHVEATPWRGTWGRMEAFSWLNLIDDPRLLNWIAGLGNNGPFPRVVRIDEGRTLLTLWETPLDSDRRAAAAYASRVWKAAGAGRRPPPVPRALRA